MTYRPVDLVELWCRDNGLWSQVSFQYRIVGPETSFITIKRPIKECGGITLRFVGNLVEWRENNRNPECFKMVLGYISDPGFFSKLDQMLEEYYERPQ